MMYSFKLFLENKFYRPENYDKIKDLPNNKELWAGANDWEDDKSCMDYAKKQVMNWSKDV